jgi:hydrogenase expression/formation protein HypE
VEVHCLRDLTRGGLASVLVQIAETAGIAIDVREEAIVVRDDVRSACELLGLGPLHVANEGCFAAFVAAKEAGRAVKILRQYGGSAKPQRSGQWLRGRPVRSPVAACWARPAPLTCSRTTSNLLVRICGETERAVTIPETEAINSLCSAQNSLGVHTIRR